MDRMRDATNIKQMRMYLYTIKVRLSFRILLICGLLVLIRKLPKDHQNNNKAVMCNIVYHQRFYNKGTLIASKMAIERYILMNELLHVCTVAICIFN